MSSLNSIHLLKYEIVFPGEVYGYGEKGILMLRNIGLVPIKNIKLDMNKEVDSNVSSFKNTLSTYVKGNRSYYDERVCELRTLDHVARLLARTYGDKLELYLKTVEAFSKVLCSMCRGPIILTRGKLEVYLAMSPSGSPFYSRDIEKRFSLEEILRYGQKVEAKPDQRQLLDCSIPKQILEPSQTRTIKLVLDMYIEWPNNRNVLINNGTTSGVVVPIQLGGDAIIKNLFENESTKDLIIIAGNGAKVKCHSLIFDGHKSTALSTLASPNNGLKESTTRRVEMKDMSEEALNHFVRYLYGMGIPASELSCDVALQLFQTSHRFEVTHLEETVCKLLYGRSNGWFTPDTILELYYFVRNLEAFAKLEEHVLRMMISMAGTLRTCERFRELNADEKEELQWKLIQLK